jgi:hypothetical protein
VRKTKERNRATAKRIFERDLLEAGFM